MSVMEKNHDILTSAVSRVDNTIIMALYLPDKGRFLQGYRM